MTKLNPMRKKLVDYLEGFGLDAGEIAMGDYDSSGFHLCRPGANRDTIHPWPEGFYYEWFVRLANAAWQEDLRLARKNHVVD